MRITLIALFAAASVTTAAPLATRQQKDITIKGHVSAPAPAPVGVGIASGLQRSLEVQSVLHNNVDPSIASLRASIANGLLDDAQKARLALVDLRARLADARGRVDPTTSSAIGDAFIRIDAAIKESDDLKTAISRNANVNARVQSAPAVIRQLEEAVQRCGCGDGKAPVNDGQVQNALGKIIDLRAQLRDGANSATGQTQSNANAIAVQLDVVAQLARQLFVEVPATLGRYRSAIETKGNGDAVALFGRLQSMRASLTAASTMGGVFATRAQQAIANIDASCAQSPRLMANSAVNLLRASLSANSPSQFGTAADGIARLRTGFATLQGYGIDSKDGIIALDEGIKAAISQYLSRQASATIAAGGDLQPMISILTQAHNVVAPLHDDTLRARLTAALDSCRLHQVRG